MFSGITGGFVSHFAGQAFSKLATQATQKLWSSSPQKLKEISEEDADTNLSALEACTTDLSESQLNPVFGREREILNLGTALLRKRGI